MQKKKKLSRQFSYTFVWYEYVFLTRLRKNKNFKKIQILQKSHAVSYAGNLRVFCF